MESLDTFKFKMDFKMDSLKFRLGAISQLYSQQNIQLFNKARENLRRSETAMREFQRQAIRLQDQCNTLQTYTLRAAKSKMKTRAQVLDQLSCDEADNGISADQPDWQCPVNTYYKAPRWTATPVVFVKSTRNSDDRVEFYEAPTAPYMERVTILRSKELLVQDKGLKASAIVFLKKLEEDGNLPEGRSIRIVRGDRVLMVNGKKLPDEEFNRYSAYMEGKDVIIISTGKAVQVTIR
jgi:hypothetical protein